MRSRSTIITFFTLIDGPGEDSVFGVYSVCGVNLRAPDRIGESRRNPQRAA
jgi:hypothetical protein